MPRLALVLVGLAALVTALPSAAQVGSGKIAYTGPDGSYTDGLYTVNPDGSGRSPFRQGAAQPLWSPDGSKIAYIDETASGYRLLVANADGTGEHTVTTTGSLFITLGSWSPDGMRLAYLLDYKTIYTASAAGGDEQQLTFDGGVKSPPVWSPDGQRIAFSGWQEAPARRELFVVGADGSGLTQLTRSPADAVIDNFQPAWSPDGSWIAFSREPLDGKPSLSVVHPDGSDLHQVAEYGYWEGAQPAWSPDGARILFTNAANGASWGDYRGVEIFVVDADGSNEQRLTELGPQIVADHHPSWSPDGALVLFMRNNVPFTMNADGTCEDAIASYASNWLPSWQAVPGGPAVEPKRCHAISVEGDVRVAGGRRTRDSITATVKNEGTEPLSNVELLVTFSHDLDLRAFQDCQVGASEARCPIGRLERGESRRVPFQGLPRRAARRGWVTVASKLSFRVVAAEPLLPTRREQTWLRFTAKECSPEDPGSGGIVGTRYNERICGRRGADRIFPGPGNDQVEAGAGADVIVAADGYRDWISCGPGRDRVTADRKDRVARDCEVVRRTA